MSTPHQRQLIRHAAVAAIQAASTAAGSKVFPTRFVPWHRLELPAVAVYTVEETSDDKRSAPRELTRMLDLAIECAVEAASGADDALDNLTAQVEAAMHADFTLTGTCSDCVLASTDIDVAETGKREIAVARLVYSVRYYTYAPDAADQNLPNLQVIDVKYNLGNAQPPGDQAEDQEIGLDI